MVMCQAAHCLEQQNLLSQKPKIDLIMSIVKLQQKQIADLTARISAVEQRKIRVIDPSNYWMRLSPKECWRERKKLTLRKMRAVLSEYEPKPYHANIWDFFIWHFPLEPSIQQILMCALWPCVEKRGETVCLRNLETVEKYCIFKNIWGKGGCRGTGFHWYVEALQELGVPRDRYNPVHISTVADEFDRAIRLFQATKVRCGSMIPVGLLALSRIWQKNNEFDEDIMEVCTSLPPGTEPKWEKPELPDPSPAESEAARADNTSVSDHQSSSGVPPDFVSVLCV